MLCRKTFKMWSELATHSQEEHNEQKEFECKVYGDKQNMASRHCKHMITHEEAKLKFNRHLNVHSDEKPYSCVARGCSFTRKLKQSLNCHMAVHSSIDFNCTICGKKFTQKHYLIEHMNNTHDEVTPCRFYWNGCMFAKRHRNILNLHENTCPFNPM